MIDSLSPFHSLQIHQGSSKKHAPLGQWITPPQPQYGRGSLKKNYSDTWLGTNTSSSMEVAKTRNLSSSSVNPMQPPQGGGGGGGPSSAANSKIAAVPIMPAPHASSSAATAGLGMHRSMSFQGLSAAEMANVGFSPMHTVSFPWMLSYQQLGPPHQHQPPLHAIGVPISHHPVDQVNSNTGMATTGGGGQQSTTPTTFLPMQTLAGFPPQHIISMIPVQGLVPRSGTSSQTTFPLYLATMMTCLLTWSFVSCISHLLKAFQSARPVGREIGELHGAGAMPAEVGESLIPDGSLR